MATTFTIDTSEKTIGQLQTIQSKNVILMDTKINYQILNYDTTMIANNDNVRGLYNAVVLNPETRRIMAVGPPQSVTFDKFKSLYGTTIFNTNTIQITELVEGVFLQFFYDERTEEWEFSTRNSVGGHYVYYRTPDKKSKTYRSMLFDALGLTGDDIELDHWNGLDHFDKNYCYHCILQHPENHMVQSHNEPRLYMIGAFELHFNDVENQLRFVPSKELKKTFEPLENEINIRFPAVYPVDKTNNTYDSIVRFHVQPSTSANLMGIVVQQEFTGDRYIHINPNYETLQKLRGTHPNLMYHYLCLKKINKLEEYLMHFPQYKPMFWKFHEVLEAFVTKLHQCYVDYFIQKIRDPIEKKLFYHIQQMHHNIYVPSLQEETKTIIRKQVVRQYIESLEPGLVFHLLAPSSSKKEKPNEKNQINDHPVEN